MIPVVSPEKGSNKIGDEVLNSYFLIWSMEKAKKESKKSCKNYHWVADSGKMIHAICTKSNYEKQWD